MFSNMRALALALAYLGVGGIGRRVHGVVESSERSSSAEGGLHDQQVSAPPRSVEPKRSQSSQQVAESDALKMLATFLLAFNPAAAWQFSAANHIRSHSVTNPANLASSVKTFPAPMLPVRMPLPHESRISGHLAASGAAALELKPPKTNVVTRALSGILFSLISVFTVIGLQPGVLSAWLYGKAFDSKRRRASDFIVQIWARLTMTLFGAGVRVEGVENLPPAGEPVMYVPNHCSFLDIFTLSGYIPRRFKYISKIEILRIPLIGWAMGYAKHIAIRRMDRASQLKTLKDAVETLKAGNSLVTFPEGTRSKDGRLAEFKKGPFTMAGRAGVRVVPVTIIGTHLFQPPGAFVPFAIPRGVRVVIHPALDAPKPKKEDETLKAARAAVESALPESMKPLPTAE